MKTEKKLFLVLVPHRDVRVALKKYSSDLTKTGIKDACFFPNAAPLAAISKPFTKDELKQYARSIRENLMERKFTAKETTAVPFPVDVEKTFLFGHVLDPVIKREYLNEDSTQKITDFFSTQVIGCYLTKDGENNALCSAPQLSFRAAAVANMYYKPVKYEGAFGCEWKIGELIWLPKNLTNI